MLAQSLQSDVPNDREAVLKELKQQTEDSATIAAIVGGLVGPKSVNAHKKEK